MNYGPFFPDLARLFIDVWFHPSTHHISLGLLLSIIPVLALLWSVVATIQGAREDRAKQLKAANRSLYQTLELASIDLFRFEAEKTEVIRPLWEADCAAPRKGTAEYIVYTNYLCQNLNLFEMAIRFRLAKVLEKDVFHSWIDWIYSVAQAPGFLSLWKDVKNNYVGCLCHIMELGIAAENVDIFSLQVNALIEKHHNQPTQLLPFPCANGLIANIRTTVFSGLFRKRNKAMDDKDPSLAIRWATDPSDIEPLVDLFIANTDPSYISHGEILCGRAKNQNEWADNLADVLRAEFKSCTPSTLGRGEGKGILGIWQDKTCLGFLVVSAETGPTGIAYATLEDIVVAKETRGQGLGKRLLTEAEKTLEHMGVSLFLLESGKTNSSAHKALESYGFLPVSVCMIKKLSAAPTCG